MDAYSLDEAVTVTPKAVDDGIELGRAGGVSSSGVGVGDPLAVEILVEGSDLDGTILGKPVSGLVEDLSTSKSADEPRVGSGSSNTIVNLN